MEIEVVDIDIAFLKKNADIFVHYFRDDAATMVKNKEGCYLLKGSYVKLALEEDNPYAKRQCLDLEKGILIRLNENSAKTAFTLLFASPKEAASYVAGKFQCGGSYWKTPYGTTLSSYYKDID